MVTFTTICAACEPIQIVNMLNSMYSKFDRLTSVHDVYKVSTCVPAAAGVSLWLWWGFLALSPHCLGFDIDPAARGRKSYKGIGGIWGF